MIYTQESIPAYGDLLVRGKKIIGVTQFDTVKREITFIPDINVLQKGGNGEPEFITVKFTARDEDSCVFVSNDGRHTIEF